MQLPGDGAWIGVDVRLLQLPIASAFTSALLDATGEKLAFVGRVWFQERTGSKSVRRVGFRFGTVTKAGGSGLTVSLQDVSTTASPGQPDETQDQTVAIANGNAAFASNTWIRTDAFSADRSVAYGSDLAVVIEFDGSGRQGSDAVNISCCPTAIVNSFSTPAHKTGGTWTALGGAGNLVLEFSDGTFGTLELCQPVKAFNSHSPTLNTTPDEYAMPIVFPAPVKVDGMRFLFAATTAASTFEFVLYEGTTALYTATVEGDRASSASGTRVAEITFPEVQLQAGVTYVGSPGTELEFAL